MVIKIQAPLESIKSALNRKLLFEEIAGQLEYCFDRERIVIKSEKLVLSSK